MFLIGEQDYYEPLGFGPADAVGVRVAGEPGERVHHMALIPDSRAPRGELRAWQSQ
jgi:predicted N-acetyltransferase YhbS